MTSSLVGSEMCIRDRAEDALKVPGGARSEATVLAYDDEAPPMMDVVKNEEGSDVALQTELVEAKFHFHVQPSDTDT
eukprot:7080400-Prorocentrum_lima.AAC.1